MFYQCGLLETIIFPENYNMNINKGTDIYYDYMFAECTSIDYIEFPNLVVANRAYYLHMTHMFENCITLDTIEFKNAKQLYSYSNYATDCLKGCSALQNIYFSECDG
jgi:hypothetical protein